MTFGEKLRQARLDQRKTLTAFCRDYGLVPSHQSQVERGLQPPPNNSKYHRVYADLFGLTIGSPEWKQFLDELMIARQHIPDDVSMDVRLPLIFEGLRTTENLDKFIEFMKGK